MEEWREIGNFPGYFVSDAGRVKAPPRRGQKSDRILKGHIVIRNGKPSYITVTLGLGRAVRAIHRLVLESFVGECPPGMEGCHNDGNGINNQKNNLRWDTHRANMHDAIAMGTFVRPAGFKAKKCVRRGAENSRAQLNEYQVQDIRKRLAGGERQASIARAFNVSKHVVAHIKLGRSWKWLAQPEVTA